MIMELPLARGGAAAGGGAAASATPLSTTVMSSPRSTKSQPEMTRAAIAPARRPYWTAQASTGPATQIAVTGITPCRMACGYCSTPVLRSRPAVTARSAPSSSGVRRSGWAWAMVVTTVHAVITAMTTYAQSSRE